MYGLRFMGFGFRVDGVCFGGIRIRHGLPTTRVSADLHGRLGLDALGLLGFGF